MTNAPRRSIELMIPGLKPQTQGSMRAIPFAKLDGSLGVRVLHAADRRLKDWRLAVRDAAARKWPWPPTEQPVMVAVLIIAPRPKSHFCRNGLSLKGRRQTRPGRQVGDVDKVLRAILDSLSGVVYRDDAQVAEAIVRKVWSDEPDAAWLTTIHVQIGGDAASWGL
jgi:Holliday junction resolvase RusA-like endonuclease